MRTKFFLLICILIGLKFSLKAESFLKYENDSAFYFADERDANELSLKSDEMILSHSGITRFQNSKLALKYQNAFHENKRLTAAMLTFALGMLGVHRLYLGTQPWIPAVYLFTFGGGFLILPLIDLGVILFTKDISKYEHNNKVLMWVN